MDLLPVAALLLLAGAAIEDLYTGEVHDVWTVFLVAAASAHHGPSHILPAAGAGLLFLAAGLLLGRLEAWGGGDTLLFAALGYAFWSDVTRLLPIYIAVSAAYTAVYSMWNGWDEPVRFAPVFFLTAAAVLAL